MRRLAPLVLAVLALPQPASAQQGEPVTYTITRAGAEIGKEVATLSDGDANNPGGTTLIVRAHYPGSPRDSALEAMLQRDAARQFVLFQLDLHDDAGGSTILAAGSGARVILRTDTPGAKAVREIPSGENLVLLDDHVLSLYQAVADLATPTGTRMVGIYPRTGRRVQVAARQGDGDQARRITLTGQLTGTLLVSSSGRLLRAELADGLVAATR